MRLYLTIEGNPLRMNIPFGCSVQKISNDSDPGILFTQVYDALKGKNLEVRRFFINEEQRDNIFDEVSRILSDRNNYSDGYVERFIDLN